MFLYKSLPPKLTVIFVKLSIKKALKKGSNKLNIRT